MSAILCSFSLGDLGASVGPRTSLFLRDYGMKCLVMKVIYLFWGFVFNNDMCGMQTGAKMGVKEFF